MPRTRSAIEQKERETLFLHGREKFATTRYATADPDRRSFDSLARSIYSVYARANLLKRKRELETAEHLAALEQRQLDIDRRKMELEMEQRLLNIDNKVNEKRLALYEAIAKDASRRDSEREVNHIPKLESKVKDSNDKETAHDERVELTIVNCAANTDIKVESSRTDVALQESKCNTATAAKSDVRVDEATESDNEEELKPTESTERKFDSCSEENKFEMEISYSDDKCKEISPKKMTSASEIEVISDSDEISDDIVLEISSNKGVSLDDSEELILNISNESEAISLKAEQLEKSIVMSDETKNLDQSPSNICHEVCHVTFDKSVEKTEQLEETVFSEDILNVEKAVKIDSTSEVIEQLSEDISARKIIGRKRESKKKYDSNVPIEKKCPKEINKIKEESPDIKTNNEKPDISVTSDIFTVDNRTVSESEVAKVAELVSPKKNVNVPVNNNCELEIKTGKVEVLPEEKSEKEIEASKNWEKNKQREELKDCKENSSSNEKYILPTEKFLNDTTNNMSLGCAMEAVEKIQENQELKKVLAVQKIDEEQERECTIKEIQNLTTALNKQEEELQDFKGIVEENTTHCVILEAQLTEKYNERNVSQQDVNSLQSSSDSRHNRLEEPQPILISEMNVLTKQKGVLPEEAENVRCNDETNGNDVTERRRIEVNSSRIISLQWVTCNDSQDLITKKRLFASVHMLSVEREMCVALQIKWACRSLKPRPPPRPPPQRDRRVISTPLFTDNGRREELMRQASLI